jgi:hypothetical protein
MGYNMLLAGACVVLLVTMVGASYWVGYRIGHRKGHIDGRFSTTMRYEKERYREMRDELHRSHGHGGASGKRPEVLVGSQPSPPVH